MFLEDHAFSPHYTLAKCYTTLQGIRYIVMEKDQKKQRLQKVLADRGVASRRKAEELIHQGKVRVNGKTALIGMSVDPKTDEISVVGQSIAKSAALPIVLLMNKPKGFICSHSDPHHEKTIFDLLPPQYAKMRLFFAGRLDKDSEGMLILSNDGALVQRITHPSHDIIKRYKVEVHKPFDAGKIPAFLKGIEDEGEHLFAKAVIPATMGLKKDRLLEIHLQQGHKREIRRLCEHFGYYVKKLKRFQIGKLTMKTVPLGSVKVLKDKDIALLLAKT